MTPEQIKKWDGTYSLAVDQLCEAGGFKEAPRDVANLEARIIDVSYDVTLEELKTRVVAELQAEGCKQLVLVSLYKIRIPYIEPAIDEYIKHHDNDECYLHIVAHGVFE